MGQSLQGVLPIVHVPFAEDQRIDYVTLRQTVDWAFSVGADGLGTGMVSEVFRLTEHERKELTEQLVICAENRGPVFAAVGGESISQARDFAQHAEQAGCAAVMAAPPLLTRLPAAEQLRYFSELAESIRLPVIVQDASSYVGSPIPLQVYVQLLERYGPEKILFKPEGAPIGPNLSALREATGGTARIYEGSGGLLLVDSYRRGIMGTMPGLDLLDGIVALWRALREGNEEAIYSLYFPICALVTLQLQAGLDGFLAIEKYLLVQRGLWSSARRREPCGWELDPETAREVDRLFTRLQLALKDRPA